MEEHARRADDDHRVKDVERVTPERVGELEAGDDEDKEHPVADAEVPPVKKGTDSVEPYDHARLHSHLGHSQQATSTATRAPRRSDPTPVDV